MVHFLILAQDATLMPSLQTVTGKSWAKSPPGSSFRRSWASGWGRWHKRPDVTSVCRPNSKPARLCVFRVPTVKAELLMFSLHREESESYVKRQSDIYEGTYKEDLTSIQSNQRYRGVHGNILRPRSISASQPAAQRFNETFRNTNVTFQV